MNKKDFIPSRDGDLDGYEQNFLNKLEEHSVKLALDLAELEKITKAINDHRAAYAELISTRAKAKSANENNVLKKRLAINELRRGARTVKANSNYSRAIGDDMQIIVPGKAAREPGELQPKLRTKVNGQMVFLKFKKAGTDGVRIYTRRGEETGFSFLVHTSKSQYVDRSMKLDDSKPEQREYYAVFFEETREVGNPSDKIKVTIE